MKIIKNFYKNYFNFKGRSTRTEFFLSKLFLIIVTAILAGAFYYFSKNIVVNVDNIIDQKALMRYGLPISISAGLLLAFILLSLIPNISITIRRLHDAGISSWVYWFYYVIAFSDYYIFMHYYNLKVIRILSIMIIVLFVLVLISVLLPSDNYNKWGLDPRSFKKRKIKLSKEEIKTRKKIQKATIKKDKEIKKSTKKLKKQIKKDEKTDKKNLKKALKDEKKNSKVKKESKTKTKAKAKSKSQNRSKTKNDNKKEAKKENKTENTKNKNDNK